MRSLSVSSRKLVLLWALVATAVPSVNASLWSSSSHHENSNVVETDETADREAPTCKTSSSSNDNGQASCIPASQSPDDSEEPSVCAMWLSESAHSPGQLGLFAGVSYRRNERISENDLMIPLFDLNLNEHTLLGDLLWNPDVTEDLDLLSKYQIQAFLGGLGSQLVCSSIYSNIWSRKSTDVSRVPTLNRSQDPMAGSISYRRGLEFAALRQIEPGQEFLFDCSGNTNHDNNSDDDSDDRSDRPSRPIEWLQQTDHAICLDNLIIQQSTIPKIGRGAFSKRAVKEGEVVTTSPVVPLHRSQLEIPEQYEVIEEDEDEEDVVDVMYTEKVTGYQLLQNYVFGDDKSDVMLLPYAPGVNFINHHSTAPNVKLVWSRSAFNDETSLSEDSSFTLHYGHGRLLVDYVALTDISPGDELFLDYGSDWQQAYEQYVQNWTPPENSDQYQSADDYIYDHQYEDTDEDLFLTLQEQEEAPYPSNIQTACLFEPTDESNWDDEMEAFHWIEAENRGCLRPCNILKRYHYGTTTLYEVEVFPMVNVLASDDCDIPFEDDEDDREPVTIKGMPASALRLVDKPNSTDEFLKTAFRKEISLPEGLIPAAWFAKDPTPMGDFELPYLQPGEIRNIQWSDSGEVVTENGYIMGLKRTIREKMLEYCNEMGITERFRNLTYRGNALKPNTSINVELKGLNWYVQRPGKWWHSNMHWISPLDAPAQDDYLRALSAAGFDEVLQQLGEHFGFKGLAAYHVTFIAVSHCAKGYMHYDVKQTGARVFNVIIPLILANETGPELDVRDSEVEDEQGNLKSGRLRYQYDIASMMGDHAYHATSAVDYRSSKEMRMAATVYVADIGEDNIDAIMADYTQNYPPKDQPDILLNMAGAHWRRDDPSYRLPEPLTSNHETAVS